MPNPAQDSLANVCGDLYTFSMPNPLVREPSGESEVPEQKPSYCSMVVEVI